MGKSAKIMVAAIVAAWAVAAFTAGTASADVVPRGQSVLQVLPRG